MPFHQCKHILIRNITASHILVNTLLLTLVKTMFGSQFDKAEKLLGETPDPLLVYGVEVSIQMYIAELSEPLRELYVVGYSLPTTSEYIYMSTAQKIQHIFSQYIKEAELKDFYEHCLCRNHQRIYGKKMRPLFYHGKQIKKITEMLLYLI